MSEKLLNEMPLVELAYMYISDKKKPVDFDELSDYCFATIGKEDIDVNMKSLFYTNLIVDGRFKVFKENKWDLKSRYKYENTNDKEAYFQTE